MKRALLCFFTALFAFHSFANSNQSAIYDITSLMTDPDSSVTLLDGTSLKISAPIVNGTKVIFEDKLPGANWGHPALYKVVDQSGKVVQEIKSNMPPRNLEATKLLSTPLDIGKNYEVDFKLNTFDGRFKVANPDKFHAVLINGRADKRHWNDFSFLYRVLTQIYGYKEENIIVADGRYRSVSPDLDGDGDNDIEYGSTLKDLKTVMGKLADKLKEDDQLILAVNDHGSTLDGEATIVLYDTQIKASEFAELFKAIKSKRILSIHEQCFSGGFVRPSVGRQKVAMAAATDAEYSWASMDLRFDEFIYHVISAFAMQREDGTEIKSDVNGDGKVSAQEAFAFAVLKDQRRESPVMESGRNAGTAASIGLNF